MLQAKKKKVSRWAVNRNTLEERQAYMRGIALKRWANTPESKRKAISQGLHKAKALLKKSKTKTAI